MRYRDYEEFIAALNDHGVRYLIAGSHAVAFHSTPRATKDLDVFVEPEAENAQRTLAALRAFFGGVDLGYTVQDLTNPQTIIQIGVQPVRIDLLMSIDGVESFASAFEQRMDATYGPVPAHYLGLKDLIAAKEAAGRPQDRADLARLRRSSREG
jgi:predicted nucleotidyltransferase